MKSLSNALVTLILLLTATTHTIADESCRADTTLIINDKNAYIQLAVDERTRRYGLMFRASMGENCGMLFVFDSTRPRVFTMRNTLIPLDIAFIDETGRIAEILSMEPGGDRYPSTVPARYALEMNKGWFASNKIGIDDVIKLTNESGGAVPIDTVDLVEPE